MSFIYQPVQLVDAISHCNLWACAVQFTVPIKTPFRTWFRSGFQFLTWQNLCIIDANCLTTFGSILIFEIRPLCCEGPLRKLMVRHQLITHSSHQWFQDGSSERWSNYFGIVWAELRESHWGHEWTQKSACNQVRGNWAIILQAWTDDPNLGECVWCKARVNRGPSKRIGKEEQEYWQQARIHEQ